MDKEACMKRKLWRKIQVGYSIYKVYLCVDLHKQGFDGMCIPGKKEILIDADLKGEEFTCTLLHELRHAHHVSTGMVDVLDAQAQELDCESFAGLVMSLGFKF
jgi:hypothetical protein